MAKPQQRQKRASGGAAAADNNTPARSTRRIATPDRMAQDQAHEPSDENETIGSRLRKKRRLNASSPFDDGSPARKRRTPNKDLSPTTKKVALQQNSKPETPARVKEVKAQVEGVETRGSSARRRAAQVDEPTSSVATEISGAANENDIPDTPINSVNTRKKSRRSTSRHPPPTEPTPPRAAEQRKMRKKDESKEETLQLDTKTIGRIIDYCAEIAQIHHYNREFGNGVDTDGLPTMGAHQPLKEEALGILDELSIQILSLFATLGYGEITELVTQRDSEKAKAYTSLKKLFDSTKKVYPCKNHLICIQELGSLGPAAANVARKANLATFVTSCFGSGDIGFFHLDRYFLETFASDGNRLLKQQAGLWLTLKTMAYFGAMNSDGNKDDVLADMFPKDLETHLLARRPGAKALAASESEFLKCATERYHLLADASEADLADMQTQVHWDDFLQDLAAYLHKNFEMIIGVPPAKLKALEDTDLCLEPELDLASVNRQRSISIAESSLIRTRHNEGDTAMKEVLPEPRLRQGMNSYIEATDDLKAVGEEFARDRREPVQRGRSRRQLDGPPRDIVAAPEEPQHRPTSAQAREHPSEPPRPSSRTQSSQTPQRPAHFPPSWPPAAPPQGYWNGFPPPYSPGQHHHANGHSRTSSSQSHSEHGHTFLPAYYYPPPPPGFAYGPPVPQGSQPQHAAYAPPYPGPPPISHPPWLHQGHPPPLGPYFQAPPPFHPQQPGSGPPPLNHPPYLQQGAPPGQSPYPPPNAPYFQQNQNFYQSPFATRRDDLPPPISAILHNNVLPSPFQSAPTSVLYERARAVANSKNNSAARNRPSNVSQRRPWTTEEETALMQGLDLVRGPHWSSILAMFGPNGTINEALKGRNQVQLKDKARNLKLFFLKSNIEVPYYLSFVTGDLKRASGPPGKVEGDYGDVINGDAPGTQSVWDEDEAAEASIDGPTTIGDEDQAQIERDHRSSTPQDTHCPLPYSPTHDNIPIPAHSRRESREITPGAAAREAAAHYMANDNRSAPPPYNAPPQTAPHNHPVYPHGTPPHPPRPGSGYDPLYPPAGPYISPFGPAHPGPPIVPSTHPSQPAPQAPPPPPPQPQPTIQPTSPQTPRAPSQQPTASTGVEFRFRPAFHHFKPPPHLSHEHFARQAAEQEAERERERERERAAIEASEAALAASPDKRSEGEGEGSPGSQTGSKATEYRFKHWGEQSGRTRGRGGSVGEEGIGERDRRTDEQSDRNGVRGVDGDGDGDRDGDGDGDVDRDRNREKRGQGNRSAGSELDGQQSGKLGGANGGDHRRDKRRYSQLEKGGQMSGRGDGEGERPTSRPSSSHRMVSGWATVNR
ncbi:MAG: TTAGGG repeat binding factor [Stictis urceolatum]|nr:TTAGGG repeat binding factor [Stictis urceolata]